MYRIPFFFLIAVIHVLVFIWLSFKKQKTGFLLSSFYVISIPLQIHYYLKTPTLITNAGALGNELFLPLGFFLFLVFAVLNFNRLIKSDFFNSLPTWVIITCIFIAISYFNPFNGAGVATSVFAAFFLSNVLFFKVLYSIVDEVEIIKGVFVGLSFLTIIHFLLAILFPLLGVNAVTSFFKNEGQESATRYDTRPGAIGTLVHPNSLALFTNIAASFFLSSWLNNYFRKASLVMLILSGCIIILTFSRTSYLAFLSILGLLYFIHRNADKTFISVGNVFKIVLPAALVLGWLIFYSPFSSMFLASDASDQIENRILHWLMALEGFYASPYIGVGLNSHLEFFADNYYLISHLAPPEFFLEHQIHNIHFIVLLETGILGFMAWLAFLIVNFIEAKKDISLERNKIFSLTQIGLLIAYIVNGFTDWAPFASEIFPIFLFINFLTIKFRRNAKLEEKEKEQEYEKEILITEKLAEE